ncbi:MAG: DUF1444 family protein [Planctomyces sp.]|nr:DUF1444 family protein [Planctomyces sp.]
MADDQQNATNGSKGARTRVRGPANWFSFLCPANAIIQQEAMITEIRLSVAQVPTSPADSVSDVSSQCHTLVIHGYWPEKSDESVELTELDTTLMFPTVIYRQCDLPLQKVASSRVSSGVSRVTSDGPWWKRWLLQRQTYQWKIWVIQRGPILIVANIQSVPGHTMRPEVLLEMETILESLEISETPAWPPDLYRRHAVELARRKFPLLRVEAGSGFALRIEDSQIQLANFYRTYLRSPDLFESILLPGITAMVRLLELGPEQLVPPLSEVRTRILPMLSPVGESHGHRLAEVPWVGGLSVRFVLDEDDSYRFIPEEMLSRWNISEDELHQIALDNLATYSAEHPLEVSVVGDDADPRMLIPTRPDVYNCSRILDQGLHGRLRELLGAELLVGIPNRDFFVALSLKHPGLIDEVQSKISEDYTTLHHPLTQRLLVISADGVSEYCGPLGDR